MTRDNSDILAALRAAWFDVAPSELIGETCLAHYGDGALSIQCDTVGAMHATDAALRGGLQDALADLAGVNPLHVRLSLRSFATGTYRLRDWVLA